jgi:hypothetical protein
MIKSQRDDGAVFTVARKEIATWLTNRSRVLTASEVATVYAAARRSETWSHQQVRR